MAEKALRSNVQVGGKWYGPDYPRNEVTSEVLKQITNPAAFEEPTVGSPDNRFRHDDFGETAPNLREVEAVRQAEAAPGGAAPGPSREDLEKLTKDELVAALEDRGIGVSSRETKDELIDRLVAR